MIDYDNIESLDKYIYFDYNYEIVSVYKEILTSEDFSVETASKLATEHILIRMERDAMKILELNSELQYLLDIFNHYKKREKLYNFVYEDVSETLYHHSQFQQDRIIKD